MGSSSSTLANFRVGFVSSCNPKRNTARVKFLDLVDANGNPLISNDFPILERDTNEDKDYKNLGRNTEVLCLCLGNGLEAGFVLGAIYNDKDKPPVNCRDKRHFRFKDGSWFEYDRKTHNLKIHIVGNIDIFATGDINLKCAGKCWINGKQVRTNDPAVPENAAECCGGQEDKDADDQDDTGGCGGGTGGDSPGDDGSGCGGSGGSTDAAGGDCGGEPVKKPEDEVPCDG